MFIKLRRQWCTYVFLNLILLQALFANGANILTLMGCLSPSHQIWTSRLVNALAEKGHNITVLTTNLDPKPPPNVHYIYLESVHDYIYKEEETDLIAMAYTSPLDAVDILYFYSDRICEGIQKSTNGLQTLLNYPKDFEFDLVLYDYSVGPCLIGFLHKFNYPPLVGFTAFNNPPFTASIVGGHNYYSYKPYFTSYYSNRMSFVERGVNLFLHALDYYKRNHVLLPHIDKISREIFGPDYPPASELELKTQLALVSTHPAIDYVEPLPPNVISVGGLQIKEAKRLPKDIDDFLNNGTEGAVLFSLGTNLKSADLGIERQLAILEAFKQLPQYNFIWKFEEADFPVALPSNVMIRKWLSQNDILNHTNVKGFVTHGGSLSTFEATWFGVPTIGIPFFGDQHTNVHRSVAAGVSEHIHFPTLNKEELKSKLLKILSDPSFSERMRIRSQRFRDQPEKPIDRAVWWIEYLMRNPDSSHLRSPTVELGFIRANSLDLYAILFSILFGVAYSISCVILRVLFILRKPAKKVKSH